jgi:hypothetical protein
MPFRFELELRSRFLRYYKIKNIYDFQKLINDSAAETYLVRPSDSAKTGKKIAKIGHQRQRETGGPGFCCGDGWRFVAHVKLPPAGSPVEKRAANRGANGLECSTAQSTQRMGGSVAKDSEKARQEMTNEQAFALKLR